MLRINKIKLIGILKEILKVSSLCVLVLIITMYLFEVYKIASHNKNIKKQNNIIYAKDIDVKTVEWICSLPKADINKICSYK